MQGLRGEEVEMFGILDRAPPRPDYTARKRVEVGRCKVQTTSGSQKRTGARRLLKRRIHVFEDLNRRYNIKLSGFIVVTLKGRRPYVKAAPLRPLAGTGAIFAARHAPAFVPRGCQKVPVA